MFTAPFYRARRPLNRFAQAMKAKNVTIGFIGGSITDQRSRDHWADMLVYELCSAYPDVSFHVVNVAIGATDSLHALFRVEQDLCGSGCDLVFVEFAVNDLGMEKGLRNRVREGLVRKLMRTGCDVAFAYTYERSMLKDMLASRLPDSIGDFEAIGEYYGIPGVFMGSYALDCVKRGRLRYEEWLPDGLHPSYSGSRFYAAPVLELLKEELRRAGEETVKQAGEMPAPMFDGEYDRAWILPFDKMARRGYWFEQQPLVLPLIRRTLSSFAPGSSLEFDFVGSGFVVMVDYGNCAADFNYRIDGGDLKCSDFPKKAWIQSGWGVMKYVVEDHLSYGTHRVELELCLKPDGEAEGCNLDICYVGILP